MNKRNYTFSIPNVDCAFTNIGLKGYTACIKSSNEK